VVDVLVIPDGAGAASLTAARTPTLDRLAAEGATARVQTTPPGLRPGSETCIPTLLGCPPRAQPGRGRVDAATYGVEVPEPLIPWRVDVLRADGSRASAAEAAAVAEDLNAIHTRGHRVLLLAATKPPDRPGLRTWDDGPPPTGHLDPPTAIVCGPGAAAGCGRLLGAQVIIPAGATGDVDTDLRAKQRAASAALREGWGRLVVHVGAPDEAAHRRDRDAVIEAIERIDAELLAPLADAVQAAGGRLTVCPDHGTDPSTGLHDHKPVPAVRWGSGIEPVPAVRWGSGIEPLSASIARPQWLWQPQAVGA
jgi:2,3-bisphosphoglycerate-independent phosphoglycerate mutase